MTVGVSTLGVTYTVPSGADVIAPVWQLLEFTYRDDSTAARNYPPASKVAPPSKLVKQKIPASLL